MAADFPEGLIGHLKVPDSKVDKLIFQVDFISERVSVFRNDVDDLSDHVLFGAIFVQEVRFGLVFADVAIAPYFELGVVSQMEHVFVDFEVPEPAVKDLKSLEGDGVEVEHIVEGDVFDFGEVGENPLVEDDSLIVASACRVVFAGEEEGRYEVVVLVAGFEVVDEEREGVWVIEGDFMGHEFITLGAVVVDFEEVAGVFEVDVLEWRFEDADLLEE